MQNVRQPPLRTDWLWPQQLTTPQVPQNLLRPSWKGYGTLGDCAGSWNSGYANCGCVGCGGGNVLTNALAGFGRRQMRRGTLGQASDYELFARTPQWLQVVYGLASLAGGAAGAYHGYVRNGGSIGWGIGWFFLGSWFWPIAIPVAFAQGFAQPK